MELKELNAFLALPLGIYLLVAAAMPFGMLFDVIAARRTQTEPFNSEQLLLLLSVVFVTFCLITLTIFGLGSLSPVPQP